MKFSISEAFKAAFKIFSRNFFVVFSLSIFSLIAIPLFLSLIQSLAIDYSSFTRIWIVLVSSFALSPSKETLAAAITTLRSMPTLWLYVTVSLITSCLAYTALFLFMSSALLPAFAGHKIKFRDYFPDFKKVFNYFLGLTVPILGVTAICHAFVRVLPTYQFSAFVSVLSFLAFTVTWIVLWIVLFRHIIFFDIEILGGGQVLKSLKNSSKLVSGNLCKMILLLLLALCIVLIILGTVMMLFKSHLMIVTPVMLLVMLLAALFIVPLFNLVRIHVYTQLSLSKSNSLGNDD